MKIWIHKYQLTPKVKGLKPRAGALVKAEWVNGQQPGYSDLHPWPEFGEPTLDEHLKSLVTMKLTPLAANSLEFNYIDREYRLSKRNAFAGLVVPRAHRLVLDILALDTAALQEIQRLGFSHIKVKMGQDLERETGQLVELAFATNLKWRLDFNGKLTDAEFTAWWTALDDTVKSRIDLVEDPVGDGQTKLTGPWANDWKKQERARIRVVKPAREAMEELSQYDRVIFTHGMDHVFGQACALWAAARYYSTRPRQMDICGLAATTEIYEQDEFSKVWAPEGPRLKPTTGMGFGFDPQLEAVEWQKIL